ncbi:MAG: hypothetical protein DRN15_02810 [Thermoprotei archaeon]|nr:MAG: hypothetical protein DRN15_02810 [Thermoprotei archaeon]RLF25366.1 MAG: hypothetical protein DRM97_02130 [Thermoprotei archaeon]
MSRPFTFVKGLLRTLRGRVRLYMRIGGAPEIARRYFVTNAFDATLTALGIIIGAYVGGILEPRVVVHAGIGGALAMGLSGFVGTYITERAERVRRLRELERIMLVELNDSLIGKAVIYSSALIAIASGSAPPLSAIITLSPFIIASQGLIPVHTAFIMAIALNLGLLFALGSLLGRISRENYLLYGVLTMASGMLVAIVGLLLQMGL